jgi:hypothetical protein
MDEFEDEFDMSVDAGMTSRVFELISLAKAVDACRDYEMQNKLRKGADIVLRHMTVITHPEVEVMQ